MISQIRIVQLDFACRVRMSRIVSNRKIHKLKGIVFASVFSILLIGRLFTASNVTQLGRDFIAD